MITLNFYRDGAYIKGHDINEICTLVSYAIWSCIEDCLDENGDVYHYESSYDEAWKGLGFSYIKINESCDEHKKILNKFIKNISTWIKLFDDRVKVVKKLDECIDWDYALADAKKEANP